LTERNRVRNKVGKSEVDVLEIVGLTKIFSKVSSQKKIVAVDDVTLGIHRGEVRILKHFYLRPTDLGLIQFRCKY
jgi:hypothetical protein